MKALSYGFVFDTEAKSTVLVAKHENEIATTCVYRTENERYFIHWIPTEKTKKESGDVESISYMEDGVEDLDDLIDELNEEFEEKVEVYLEHFPIG